ncbi:cytochrome-c oxidase, cbb3-type subunit III [Halioglobus maricola]|uniref:Cbb3-type cytochrome c oxidase subunit n=1 Tax=Halioglobus maricola TaxID=2601894 RepID=A0A5P9NLB7_9GAMM|nr:cytochrome-c oxidase, cbb3-type subunit III [Halioglobus maricola]QFU76542.1 cytochrome-c oxidase, cbb3-type subunit III [Halioglobus maricola]
MTSFWSLWVIILTSLTIILVTWVLFGNRSRENPEAKTTGHVYDGIEEYDNPMPAWWFMMFVITIVFGIGYLIVYPGMGNYEGVLGWTQVKQHDKQVAAADERYRDMRDRYLALPIEEIASDPAVRKMGMRMFSNNCALCHGADAKGAYGFPNLTDDDWLYGGSPDAIKASIVHGRQAAMPPWGGILGDKGVADVSAYVMSLSGREVDPAQAEEGSKHYQTYCLACHAADGTGNPALGAPNLANGIWLYGGSMEQISHSVRAGRNGVMPAQKKLLSEDKIHILTAYVYGLSN